MTKFLFIFLVLFFCLLQIHSVGQLYGDLCEETPSNLKNVEPEEKIQQTVDFKLEYNIVSTRATESKDDVKKFVFRASIEILVKSVKICELICINFGLFPLALTNNQFISDDVSKFTHYLTSLGLEARDAIEIMIICNETETQVCKQINKTGSKSTRSWIIPLGVFVLVSIICLGVLLFSKVLRRSSVGESPPSLFNGLRSYFPTFE
ncbi:hypothetical protein RF11_08036 [Thelohanellus kitauei]|uniref:Uncharacterized protein n=1 Tax=Thelohanellus kitauei TaxID=669202 RepID=A0A0C2JGW0_THEKT|nr:hypothetical protein RF11_08036 [Thelohanellus kitauei]